jgi:lipopolysaccharide biosynthesis protein
MNKNSVFLKYLNRPLKELIKGVTYPCFKKWLNESESYQDWFHARSFSAKKKCLFTINGWRQRLLLAYYQKTPADLNQIIPETPNLKLAIVVHVFYLEVFKEIMEILPFVPSEDIKFYITTTSNKHKEVESILSKKSIPYLIMDCENRGRDILPFLLLLPSVIADDRNVILKLHTKGSNHLNRKHLWKNDLYNKLIGHLQIANCLNLFRNYPSLGMIAPEGHVLPMILYYGSNALRIKNLLGLNDEGQKQHYHLDFIAGSMFYARTKVLQPLLHLNLTNEDFEIEDGQLDGTLAHAVERIFSWYLPQLGYYLGDTNPASYPDIKYKVTVNHKFTI